MNLSLVAVYFFATKPLKWTQRAEVLICCSWENSFPTRYSM